MKVIDNRKRNIGIVGDLKSGTVFGFTEHSETGVFMITGKFADKDERERVAINLETGNLTAFNAGVCCSIYADATVYIKGAE